MIFPFKIMSVRTDYGAGRKGLFLWALIATHCAVQFSIGNSVSFSSICFSGICLCLSNILVTVSLDMDHTRKHSVWAYICHKNHILCHL